MPISVRRLALSLGIELVSNTDLLVLSIFVMTSCDRYESKHQAATLAHHLP